MDGVNRQRLRDAVLDVIDELLREPTEAEWEALELRLTATAVRVMPPGRRDLDELLTTAPGKSEVSRWARECGVGRR